MKKFISIILLSTFTLAVFAQDQTVKTTASVDSNTTTVDLSSASASSTFFKKKTWMASINFGVGSHIGATAAPPNLSTYSLSAPMAAWFDKTPILEVEGRYFITNDWSIKCIAGFVFGHNPTYNEVTGTGSAIGDIPTYSAVPASDNIQFNITLGADRYFSTHYKNIYYSVGGEAGYAYGKVAVNAIDNEAYMGASVGEAFSLSIAPVVGMDYFITPALFLGIDVRPIDYQYSVYRERPQAGLSTLSSDNSTISLIARPTLKLGIRF